MNYLVLALAAISYAVAFVAQTVAARRAERRDRLDLGLLARLAGDRLYLFGFAAQVAGFVLAFLARAELPLYLVQAALCSAVGLAAVIGVVLLGWRVWASELGTLAVLTFGLILLVGAAQPSAAHDVPPWVGLGLLGLLVVVAGLAVFAARLPGPRGSIVMGGLAGVAFAVLAIASRPLASGPVLELPRQPLTWLMVAAVVIGQWLLAVALQHGSTTATMASMNATATMLASVAGLLVLGDQIAAGRGAWVGAGLTLVVGGVVALAVVARPHETPQETPQETSNEVAARRAMEGQAFTP